MVTGRRLYYWHGRAVPNRGAAGHALADTLNAAAEYTKWCALLHRHESELVHQPHVAVAVGVGRGQELRPVED